MIPSRFLGFHYPYLVHIFERKLHTVYIKWTRQREGEKKMEDEHPLVCCLGPYTAALDCMCPFSVDASRNDVCIHWPHWPSSVGIDDEKCNAVTWALQYEQAHMLGISFRVPMVLTRIYKYLIVTDTNNPTRCIQMPVRVTYEQWIKEKHSVSHR